MVRIEIGTSGISISSAIILPPLTRVDFFITSSRFQQYPNLRFPESQVTFRTEDSHSGRVRASRTRVDESLEGSNPSSSALTSSPCAHLSLSCSSSLLQQLFTDTYPMAESALNLCPIYIHVMRDRCEKLGVLFRQGICP